MRIRRNSAAAPGPRSLEELRAIVDEELLTYLDPRVGSGHNRPVAAVVRALGVHVVRAAVVQEARPIAELAGRWKETKLSNGNSASVKGKMEKGHFLLEMHKRVSSSVVHMSKP